MGGRDLRAVAARAGVSVSTASRALAGSPRISERTRGRVSEAAAALAYRPNATARALRAQRSQLVGLVVTNLANASLNTIAEVVQRALADAGLPLVLSVSHGDAETERAAIHTLVDLDAVGVVVVGSDLQATSALGASGIPVVHLARRPVQPAGDCVLVDDVAGAQAATDHLLGLGHRRIAVIAGAPEVTSGRERVAGWSRAMELAGLDADPALVVAGPFTRAFGVGAVGQLLDQPASTRPTALVVTNHEAAFGVMPALAEAGIDVPGDLSVVCYEDADLARWWRPAITVVDIDPQRMGELAAQRLLQRLDAPDEPFEELRVRTHLVVRSSTAPVAGRASAP